MSIKLPTRLLSLFDVALLKILDDPASRLCTVCVVICLYKITEIEVLPLDTILIIYRPIYQQSVKRSLAGEDRFCVCCDALIHLFVFLF